MISPSWIPEAPQGAGGWCWLLRDQFPRIRRAPERPECCLYTPHPPGVALVLRFWEAKFIYIETHNLLHLHQDINMPTSVHKHTKNGFHWFETSFFKLKLHLGLVCKLKGKYRTKATPYTLQVKISQNGGFFPLFLIILTVFWNALSFLQQLIFRQEPKHRSWSRKRLSWCHLEL